MPLDERINYFLLVEFGKNGVAGENVVVLTDASLTFSHIPTARIRIGQFKYPGPEEGYRCPCP